MKNKSYKLTIIVCTYNRGDLLAECLESLVRQDNEHYRLLVVDNASTDQTRELVSSMSKQYPKIEYTICEEVGLSAARNHGAALVETEWLGYIDDDAIVESNFTEIVIGQIENAQFDAFGGVYRPWYRYGRPIWYSDLYGSNITMAEREEPFELRKDQYMSGGIAFYRTELVVEGEGFPTNFGMKGEEIGYGEENVIQDAIRANGWTIGFVPSVEMLHLVAPYKLKLSWHLRSQYSSGKAETRRLGTCSIAGVFSRMIVVPVVRVLRIKPQHYSSVVGFLLGVLVTYSRGVAYYLGRLHKSS